MDNLTWKELYYRLKPATRKDPSFSSYDLIRFFEHNLDPHEMAQVKEYFRELLEPPLKPPDISPLPDLPSPLIPLLPLPPFIPLPLPIPPQPLPLPPPGPKLLPPVFPGFLLPVFPFIIWELLPPDMIDYLKQLMGVPELHAAVLDAEEETSKWYDKYWDVVGVIPRHPPGTRPPRTPTILHQIDAEVSQIDTEVSQIETDPWDDPFFTEPFDFEEDPFETETPPAGPSVGELVFETEEYEFYSLLSAIEGVCNRSGLDFAFRYWVYTSGNIWYRFNFEGDDLSFTLDQVYEFLNYLTKLEIESY